MSSARARILPSLGRAVRGLLWTALFAVLAAGAAGLIAGASHTPGGSARAELTSEGDAALGARLDGATQQLQSISDAVDSLADAAKTALEQVASSDPTKLQESLEAGDELGASIDAASRALKASLADLPGAEPDAIIRYSNDTLVRRAAVLAALEATTNLDALWQQVTGKATEASQVTTLIGQHDQTVLDAAALGTKRQYAEASATLDRALLTVVDVKAARNKLIPDIGPTVLDEWIDRDRDYDLALKTLYDALVASGGKPTAAVVTAQRAERQAFKRLPPDRRTIIVIVAEVARGGLTQAVLAVEDARGRLEDALAGAAAAPGASPGASEGPGGSGSPTASESPRPGQTTLPLP
jgi:hypothetical protein